MNSKPKWLAKLPNRVDQFLATYQERHRRFVKAAKFSGPSLYFHHKALSAQNTAPTSFSDASYAMLVSWGMHRMGKGGAKMVAFDVYEQSLRKVAGIIRALRSLDPETIDSVVLGNLREVFFGIHAMTGKTHLVANSKVMAHALPQLIAPIDRQYTLKYLCGTNSVSISQDRNEQWEVLRATHQHFFYPICRDPGFKKAATLWVSTPASAWDTSILKVIDNCIMAGDPDDRADESPE